MGEFQAGVGFSVEGAGGIFFGEAGDGFGLRVEGDHLHVVAEVVATVEPLAVGTAGEEEVGREVVICAVAVFVDEVFAVGHEEEVIGSPGAIGGGGF